MKEKINTTEPSVGIGPTVQLITSGIGPRINALSELVGGKEKLSELSGLSASQLRRVIAESSQTKIEIVAAMARAAGVSIEWLVTGEGEMRSKSEEQAAAARDVRAAYEGDHVAEERLTYSAQAAGQRLRELRLTLERIESAVGYTPTIIWRETIKTLMYTHGLDEAGVERIVDLLKQENQLKEKI